MATYDLSADRSGPVVSCRSAALRLSLVLVVHAALLLVLLQLDPELRRHIEPVLVSLISPSDPVAEPRSAPARAPTQDFDRADASPPRGGPRPSPETVPTETANSAEAPPVQSSAVSSGSAPARESESLVAALSAASRPAPAPVPVVPPRFDVAYLNNPRPEYPRVSKRIGEHGKVLLRVYVSAAGEPEQVEIRTSSGSPRLDEAARQAVWHWKFVPARQGGDEVAAWIIVPITFVLEG